MNLIDLHKPFPPNRISWRVGSTNADKTKGMALAYIDARDVMQRLDEICGALWQAEYVPMPNGTCCCRVGIKVVDDWVWRSNGAINLTDSDKADQKEMTEKGSYSDAFKRAAVLWGVGRYLYDLDSPWVALEAAGKSFKIAAHEYPRLEALLSKTGPKPLMTERPAPDQDIEDGVRNWGNQRRAEIDDARGLPDLYAWKETHDASLARLHAKHPSAWQSLMQHYQAKFVNLSKRA